MKAPRLNKRFIGSVMDVRASTLLSMALAMISPLPVVAQNRAQSGSAGHVTQGPALDVVPRYSMIHGMKVYRIGNGVSPPRLLGAPIQSFRSGPDGEGGTVLIWAVVDRLGRVRYPRIIHGLDDAQNIKALDAVKQWKFAPGEWNGLKVAIATNLEVKFS